MTSVERTFTVRPAQSVVVDYLADFGNATEWDPGTETCERQDSGPVVVGSSWHNVSKFFGATTELTYTLEELTAERVVLVGRNDTVTSTDAITVRPGPDGEGSELTYHVDLELSGAAKLAAPAMKLAFEKLAHDTEKQMTEVLNRLA